MVAERDRIVHRFNMTGTLAEHEQAVAEEGDKLAWFKQKRPSLSAELESAVRASLDRNKEQSDA